MYTYLETFPLTLPAAARTTGTCWCLEGQPQHPNTSMPTIHCGRTGAPCTALATRTSSLSSACLPAYQGVRAKRSSCCWCIDFEPVFVRCNPCAVPATITGPDIEPRSLLSKVRTEGLGYLCTRFLLSSSISFGLLTWSR